MACTTGPRQLTYINIHADFDAILFEHTFFIDIRFVIHVRFIIVIQFFHSGAADFITRSSFATRTVDD